MTKRLVFLALLCCAMAFGQSAGQGPSSAPQQAPKEGNDEITVTGCVSKLNTNFILMQSDPGHSYKLQESNRLDLRQYLGKEVEITGVELPSVSTTLSTESHATPLTLRIESIKAIHKKCSAH